MASIFARYHCDTREAGQLYTAWRKASPTIRERILDAPDLFFKTQRHAQEKAPAGTGAELSRDLQMVAAIVNRAHRRLTGAAAAELDAEQGNAAPYQIERILKHLRRIDDAIPPEKEQHIEPSAAHHDSGTEHSGSEQMGDRAGDGNLPRGGAQGPALEVHSGAGTHPARLRRG
jgi:hypothetical protein